MGFVKVRTENAAELGAFLQGRRMPSGHYGAPPVDAARLQAIARRLHRLDERNCNGELPECPKCRGDGCPKCAGRGHRLGRTENRLEEEARDIAGRYACRLYVQGDPRGWPLYLIPQESGPPDEDASRYNGRGVAVCPH